MDSRFYKSGNRQCVLPERSKVTYNLEHLKIVVRLMYHGTRASPWARRLDSRSLSPSQPRTVDDDTQRRALIDKKPNRFADLLSNKITSANSDSGQPAYAASRRW
ncbi:hypothetical protein HBI91_223980 [Parastagonospora nodorum]|nr:hypothetical protein HBI91_223980 [Parastagonospora nodorum]